MNFTYVDFGYTSAQEYWEEVARTSQRRFLESGTRGDAIVAAITAWSLLEWIWHDQKRGTKTLVQFRTEHCAACPELTLLRDVADAGKHRGLGRKPTITSVEGRPIFVEGAVEVEGVLLKRGEYFGEHLHIVDDNGNPHPFADVLSAAIAYWHRTYFERSD